MARPVKLTHGDRAYRREKVLAALAAGERIGAVAARLGLSHGTVQKLGARAGIRQRIGRWPCDDGGGA